MAELFCELFSEEIPARLQEAAAADLARLAVEALAALSPEAARSFWGPRRIALALRVAPRVPAATRTERGPRLAAPEAALAGFLRKHAAAREALQQEGDFWILEKSSDEVPASQLVAEALPALLRRFPWPKSMRWGTSGLLWIRPLRRICCLLDGVPVRFSLATAEDAAHGLAADALTEGHRFMAPGPVAVHDVVDWEQTLRARYVIVDAAERQRRIADGVAARAAAVGARVVDDPGLLREVAGLVEWPVCLLGRIDPQFMDLPPEVMQVSMRVNQKYFAICNKDGSAAPYFGFAANIEAADGGTAIVIGNERVLRARFSDARHFWDLDRRTRLADRVPALAPIVFHAKLGSQLQRAHRIAALARCIADETGADAELAARAGELCKADLTTGLVGEFPELQGIMGGYYARHDGEAAAIADALRDHYLPKGPADRVPSAPVAVAVALADKVDQIAAFATIGEMPTGSGDPFALRRAALGIIRILIENNTRLKLEPIFRHAAAALQSHPGAPVEAPARVLVDFVRERLRVMLRGEGVPHEAIQSALAGARDDDITRIAAKSRFLAAFFNSEDGRSLLAAFRRAANILRIEWASGEDEADADPRLLRETEEQTLYRHLQELSAVPELLNAEAYGEAFGMLATLRRPVDAFFDKVLVNDADPEIRRNRLRLLGMARHVMNKGANFAAITG